MRMISICYGDQAANIGCGIKIAEVEEQTLATKEQNGIVRFAAPTRPSPYWMKRWVILTMERMENKSKSSRAIWTSFLAVIAPT